MIQVYLLTTASVSVLLSTVDSNSLWRLAWLSFPEHGLFLPVDAFFLTLREEKKRYTNSAGISGDAGTPSCTISPSCSVQGSSGCSLMLFTAMPFRLWNIGLKQRCTWKRNKTWIHLPYQFPVLNSNFNENSTHFFSYELGTLHYLHDFKQQRGLEQKAIHATFAFLLTHSCLSNGKCLFLYGLFIMIQAQSFSEEKRNLSTLPHPDIHPFLSIMWYLSVFQLDSHFSRNQSKKQNLNNNNNKSSSSAFPSYISGVHNFWARFLHMWPFFNPTIKVVTFRLCGWCVLGMFFVAGIHPSGTWTSGSFESV